MDNSTLAAEKLSLRRNSSQEGGTVKATSIAPQDAVIETVDGSRLQSVPVAEVERLNRLKVDIGPLSRPQTYGSSVYNSSLVALHSTN